MDFGFPKMPRHVAETGAAFAEAMRTAYLGMIAEHTQGAITMPEDITLIWSNKGKPLTLWVRMMIGKTIDATIVHAPSDPEEIAQAKLSAASRMIRIALRRSPTTPASTTSASATSDSAAPAMTFLDAICPVLVRRALVHHRFGLDRLETAFQAPRAAQTRRFSGNESAAKFSMEYRRRGRSSDLLAERPGDNMPNLKIWGTTESGFPEIVTIHLNIAEGIVYKYAWSFVVRDSITIDDDWPATTCSAVAGRRLEDIITHDMFRDCGHIIEEAGPWNGKTRLVLSPSYDTIRGF